MKNSIGKNVGIAVIAVGLLIIAILTYILIFVSSESQPKPIDNNVKAFKGPTSAPFVKGPTGTPPED